MKDFLKKVPKKKVSFFLLSISILPTIVDVSRYYFNYIHEIIAILYNFFLFLQPLIIISLVILLLLAFMSTVSMSNWKMHTVKLLCILFFVSASILVSSVITSNLYGEKVI